MTLGGCSRARFWNFYGLSIPPPKDFQIRISRVGISPGTSLCAIYSRGGILARVWCETETRDRPLGYGYVTAAESFLSALHRGKVYSTLLRFDVPSTMKQMTSKSGGSCIMSRERKQDRSYNRADIAYGKMMRHVSVQVHFIVCVPTCTQNTQRVFGIHNA